MRLRIPDTGEIVTLYPTDELIGDLRVFHEAVCDHAGPNELRIFTARNGAKHYRHQCQTCGQAVGQNVSKTRPDVGSLRPFDEALPKKYRASRNREESTIIRRHIRLQSNEDVRFSNEYKEYLASDRWAAKRVKVLERARNLCEGCGEARATEVHHLNYNHLFDEFLFELVALCHSCHTRWHRDDESPEADEPPCCGCRFRSYTDEGVLWCGAHDQLAGDALALGGPCGPERKTLEPLK